MFELLWLKGNKQIYCAKQACALDVSKLETRLSRNIVFGIGERHNSTNFHWNFFSASSTQLSPVKRKRFFRQINLIFTQALLHYSIRYSIFQKSQRLSLDIKVD